MQKILISTLLMCIQSIPLFAQQKSAERISDFRKLKSLVSPVQGIPFRNIGPTIMSGRVTDLEINPSNPNEFYIAYASGGVWHTVNNGQSMTPIFDKEASITIGDMAMDWQTQTLWVGTGEVNSSRSSYAGTGVYKTTDTGKTWIHCGLEESHHIGRIVLHPTNPQVAWVAVLGHLYTPNPERGIYKTTDGGQHWQQTLFVNDTTGCPDLAIDPSNADHLYAVSWTRTRQAWQFNGSGACSGIYQSTDGGENWTLITDGKNGIPVGKGTGRIGLSICAGKPQTIYAVLDNQLNQPEKKDEVKKIKARDLEKMNRQQFLKMPNKDLETYLRDNEYPSKYTADSLKKGVENNSYTVKDIADWKLSDADASLFETPVYGAELYRSDDAGKTWKKTHAEALEGVVFTYGYYFGTVAVSPTDPEKVLIAGYPLILSRDGGKTFTSIDGDNCHPDYHRIWINPKNDQHIITGNDGGVNITYDDGQRWFKANNPAVGQFYTVAVDDAQPYNVYGGLQDNGTWTGPSTHTENNGWHQSGRYAYQEIGGGDGMQVQVDTRDNSTVYAGYQFGNYARLNKNGGSYTDCKPVHDIGQKPYRFNWQTPICLSKHNQDVLYLGSNCFHRSLQKGEKMETLSEDLTRTTMKGNVPYGTLTTISESPLKFGWIYVGTDDGHVYSSKDIGYNWTNISSKLPQHLWVSRVIGSKFNEDRVYVTLNGYRQDDFTAYVYRSDNHGKTWIRIFENLPDEPVNVIREDTKDENILYVGTDNGLYISFNQGKSFYPWDESLPRVAIHDMVIQERENELVLGTHGRSIYIAKLDYVQQYPQVKDKALALFDLENVPYNKSLGIKQTSYSEPLKAELSIPYFTQQAGPIHVSILSDKKKVLTRFISEAKVGMNIAKYNFQIDEKASRGMKPAAKKSDDGQYYLQPGKYFIQIRNAQGITQEKEFSIQEKE
ncbi:MAG: hypothetical protein JNJ58_07050 [Chitinophagaceae bacterium]|nr:hypothetical protein [Chitinophagaceae bacterium]